MKRAAFLLAAIAFIALSCNSGGDKLVVKGTIENANNNKIFLSKTEGQQQMKADSATLGEDGSFTLEAPLEHKRFLYLGQVSKNNYIQLIGKPGDEITVNASMPDLGSDYSVAGSEESENVRYLTNLITSTQQSIDSLRSAFEKEKQGVSNEDEISSMHQSNQSQIRSLAEDFYAKKTEFIDEHLGDLSTMVGLSGLNINEYFSYYEKVDSALMEEYPNNPEVKNFHQFVERRKKEVQAKNKSDEKLAKGKTAPDFTLKNPDDEPRTLSDLRGNYVLLDFWASWCQPCRKENPNLVENYKKYSDQGFEIFQVSLDRTRDAWLKGIKEDNLGRWYHAYDSDNKVAQMYNIRAIPASFLLNKKGEIVAKNLRGEQLESHLSRLFE